MQNKLVQSVKATISSIIVALFITGLLILVINLFLGQKIETIFSLVSKVSITLVENTEQELDEIEEDWDSIEDDEEVSKPISEMNNAELKEYATKLGIDISGLSSNKQLREAIKAVI